MRTGLASDEFYDIASCTFRAALHWDLKEMVVRDTHSALNTYAGRSAQKIISRAQCNHLARNPHFRTKLINYLARNPLVISHVSLTHRMNTQTPPRGDFEPYSG